MRTDVSTHLNRLRRVRDNGDALYVVHYACESLSEVRAGPPCVSAIGFHGVYTDETFVYSVADRAENAEEYVLRAAFEFLRDRSGAIVAHWRMASSEFGFVQLSNRYFALLNEQVRPPPADSLVDIARMISAIYGDDFADHPQLANIVDSNGLKRRHFLSGAEEAARIKDGNHAIVRRSLAEKLSHLAAITRRLLDGTLETKWHGRRVAFAGSYVDCVQLIETLGVRLIDVARQLSRRYASRTTLQLADEYDYQDLLHSMLRMFFDDVRAESYAPDYAGGASRVDFRLPAYGLVIELKHPKSFKDKDLADQLIVDIARYRQIPQVRHLICIVFDEKGTLDNPRGLESDLARNEGGLSVIVKIVNR